MKQLIALVLISVVASAAVADTFVKGHFRKDGTYVEPYVRSSPNSTKLDNYSNDGNFNPYTGKEGNASPYPDDPYPSLTRPKRGWK